MRFDEPEEERITLNAPKQIDEDHSIVSIKRLSQKFNLEEYELRKPPMEVEEEIIMHTVSDFGHNIKPRYETSTLKYNLTQFLDKTRGIPLDFYDIDLYELNKHWHSLFGDKQVDISCIEDVHCILRLPHSLVTEDIQKYSEQLQREIQEYNLLKDALELVCSVAVKYKVVNMHKFNYRLVDRTLNTKILDISELNCNFYTLECLWLASAAHLPPFSNYVPESTKQLAIVLSSKAQEMFEFIFKMNDDLSSNLNAVYNFVASNNPRILRRYSFLYKQGNEKKIKVNYQSLKIRDKTFFCCFKVKCISKARQLKTLIRDFDSVYREFEREFIGTFLKYINS